MKHTWFLLISLFFQNTFTAALTITGVKVSVTADSAAAARDQAITKAYTLAFQKLLKEHFPDSPLSFPPEDDLVDMVTNFSIDREKTTPKSYAASLTFHFDDSRLQEWRHQDFSSSTSPTHLFKTEETLIKITADYSTFTAWQHIKRTLEHLPGIEKIKIISLSDQSADLEITYKGDLPQLQQRLSQENLLLVSQGQNWKVSPNVPSSHSQVIY